MGDRKRIISYKKVQRFDSGHNSTLENAMKDSLEILPNVEDRKFSIDFFSHIKCIESKVHEDGVYLYLVRYSEDTKASLVPLNVEGKKGEIKEMPPKDNTSFLTNDLNVLIKGNEVCICSGGGSRESSAEKYLKDLIEKAKLPESSLQFTLKNVANSNNIELIKKHGVREIDLDVSMCLSSFEEMNYKHYNSGQKIISSLLYKDKTETEKQKTSKQSANLIIKRGQLKKDDEPIENWITQKAEEIAESNSLDYSMKLGNGQLINSSSLQLKKSIIVDIKGSTVNHEKVWMEMQGFYNEHSDNQKLAS